MYVLIGASPPTCGYLAGRRRRLRDDRTVDHELRERAMRQGGVFTWQDVRACLLGESAVRAAIRRGQVVRVRRDAYVLADLWHGARPSERLALRTRAVLRARPRDVASHQSALALHGLPIWGVPRDIVDVMADVSRTRTVSGLRVHAAPEGLEPVNIGGFRAVGIGEAVAQVAARHGPVAALVPLDHALHERMCTVSGVRAAGDALAPGGLGRARFDAVLARADRASESVGETRTRVILEDLGYAPASQVRLHDAEGFIGRVDFLIDDAVVVEFDGMVKYEGADGREALAKEKRREERLTAAGCVVIRLVWSDLDHPERIRALVESARQRVARRR